MMNVLILAAEEAEGAEGGASVLLPHLNELVPGLIAFTLIFFFIWKKAGPALNQLAADRQAAIAGQIKEAEAAKDEAHSLLKDYKQQVSGAKAEANAIVEDARKSADVVKAGIVAEANDEAAAILVKAQADADGEKARALAEARSEVAGLSVALAEKVVGGSLDAEKQKELIDQYITELEGE